MANWNRTKILEQRLEEELYSNPTGRKFYQGRPIINRDSPVDGGVCLGGSKREAIVVDSRKYPALRNLYQIAKRKAETNREFDNTKVLWSVFTTVSETLRHDSDAVERIVKRYGVEQDGKITLDRFIDESVGVCRHQALACAALLELFKSDGHIPGQIRVNRNATYRGGHAWCRYTNSIGQVMVLDVAQDYLGLLKGAPKNVRWPYERPDDF